MKDIKHSSPDILDKKYYAQNFSEMNKQQFDTCDVILLRGCERISQIIQTSTRSAFSHCALLIREPPEEILDAFNTPAAPDGLYLFESDTETDDGRVGGGVQLVPFVTWLTNTVAEYGGEVLILWRKLHWAQRPPPSVLWARDGILFLWMQQMAKILYKQSKRELVLSVFHLNPKDNFDSVFCSELVAATYQKLGLFNKGARAANNFLPKHFAAISDSDRLPLAEDVTLAYPIRMRLHSGSRSSESSTPASSSVSGRPTAYSEGAESLPQPHLQHSTPSASGRIHSLTDAEPKPASPAAYFTVN